MSDRPVPKVTIDDREFWDSAKRHELMLQHCDACQRYFEPPVGNCAGCGSSDISWRQASGRGVLHTFNVYHRPYHPWFADRLPYNTAIIELAEGVLLLSQVTNCALDDLRIGMSLEVVFEDIEGGFTLPKFQPVPGV